jgi:glycosyltransferase involved in cell wall biosynthesis
MCRQASAAIVYTASDREALQSKLVGRTVWAAPNAITASSEMHPAVPVEDAASFVFSGRLVADKKPDLALEGFALAVGALPDSATLEFVGTGPLKAELAERAKSLGVAERVQLHGTVFDVGELELIYSRSIASLSPGYVGLSMTQSHGFGVPMIYAADEPHAPEIEAADEGFNCVAIASDDAAAMAAAMTEIAATRTEWLARREAISARSRDSYSVEAMARGFLAAVTAIE